MRIEQLALPNQAARALHQISKYSERLGRQQDALVVSRITATPQTLVDGIEPEVQEFLALHRLYAFLYGGSSLAAPGAFSERATERPPRMRFRLDRPELC